MDDTRDIAIRADEAASSAHKRLDGINGQIARLGESHERMRADFTAALNDPETGLRADIAAMRTDVRVEKVKVAAMVAAVSIVFTGVTSAIAIAVAEHYAAKTPTPTQAVQKP